MYPTPPPQPDPGSAPYPPTSGVPAPGYGYPTGPVPDQGPRRRGGVALVTVISIVLGLSLIISGVVVLTTLGGVHHDVGALTAQRNAQQAADAQAQAKLREEFQQADLSGKLAKVRDLTTAAQQALLDWNAQPESQQASTIHVVQDAINKCDLAVFDYDSTAAQFPANLLAGLPTAIDTTDPATDCGRLD